jgi:hypothetical protein
MCTRTQETVSYKVHKTFYFCYATIREGVLHPCFSLLPLGRGGILWQVLGVRDEFSALHVRLQNLGYTETLKDANPVVSNTRRGVESWT